jgi:D-3-phosphoglycerate dehydrogenase / 2-oxoglutarate reductase
LSPAEGMTKRYKVAITDHTIDSPDVEREILGSMSDILLPHRLLASEDELIKFVKDVDAILDASEIPITDRIMDAIPNLRIVSCVSVGFDNVDVQAASERGIVVTNVPDYCSNEVADHAMTLIMALARQLFVLDGKLRSGTWGDKIPKMVRVRSSSSQVLGLVAFGRIPRRVAARARSFGFRVIAYDPYVPRWDFDLSNVERVQTLHELMSGSDIISVHLPLNAETRHLIGEEEIGAMKPGAFFVNTGRGQTVDQAALTRALMDKRIAGAALDVFEREPPDPADPLFKLDNVIVTPHVASYSEESMVRVRAEAANTVADLLCGRRPQFILNPQVLAEGRRR